jgi:micrococcal nuclease
MEAVYTLVSFLTVLVIPVLLFIGLAKPKLFQKSLGKNATRGRIAGLLVVVFIGLALVGSAVEPESVKLARQQKEQAQQQQTAQKAAELQQQQSEQVNTEAAPEAKVEQASQEITQPTESQERYYWHRITKVVDGDTVKAMVDGKEESIRIIGINAPESTTKTECFGKNASDKAKDILKDGWIQLERDDSQTNRDKYSRLLRFVWAGDGSTDFGLSMINEGYAYEYTYNVPYAKQQAYKEAQKNADTNNKGLWASDNCDGQKQKPQPAATKLQPQPAAPAPTPAPRTAPSPPPSPGGVVKKSNSDICHAPGTTYYNRTKNYTPYNSLQACLNSGGRLPLR